MKPLSLVVPCYNESDTVERLYDEFLEVFGQAGLEFETVFVNDGSRDDTPRKLRQIAKKDLTAVKVVNFARNFGKDAAILAGLDLSDGEITVIIDGDLQQSPATVVEMYRYLEENPDTDCVAAVQDRRREGCVLSMFKRTFYSIINRLSQVEFVAGASDFRAFRRPMRDAILNMREYFRFSKGIFSFVGFETHFLPYEARARGGGVSKWSFWKLLRYAIDGIVGFSIAPLRFITILGMLVSFASFAYLVVVIIQKLINGANEIRGYPTIITLILLLGGFQLLALGIIGEYLGRNYIETKKRPIYIMTEVIKNKPAAEDERPGTAE